MCKGLQLSRDLSAANRKWNNKNLRRRDLPAASRANIFRLDTVPGNPATEGEDPAALTESQANMRAWSLGGMMAPANFDHSGRQGQTGYYPKE